MTHCIRNQTQNIVIKVCFVFRYLIEVDNGSITIFPSPMSLSVADSIKGTHTALLTDNFTTRCNRVFPLITHVALQRSLSAPGWVTTARYKLLATEESNCQIEAARTKLIV
jgi:hypothetical protein